MSKVVSILGMPYVLPPLVDRRGKVVSFRARLANGGEVLVSGTATVYGLVLHRVVQTTGERQKATWCRWVVSEPKSGCRVGAGQSRQAAIDSVAGMVAYLGGEDAFKLSLDEAVAAAGPAEQASREKSAGSSCSSNTVAPIH
ncbi:hypothetical protein [Ottowia sp.]|uniref:hypothetical protein n=1 Tax=Ottowia sp. TaxID=1898956 RepID=UPI0025DA8302|nr:hypothetical protein [Ottowia sp.]MBK6616086.1 hypothetical protein [Ottowia sp.]